MVGRITDSWGERKPAFCGLGLNIVAFLWIAFLANGSGFWILVPGLLAMGIAVSFMFVPPMHAVANALPDEKQGQAGGIMLTGQLLGGTMGMTVLGIVLIMTGDFRPRLCDHSRAQCRCCNFGLGMVRVVPRYQQRRTT